MVCVLGSGEAVECMRQSDVSVWTYLKSGVIICSASVWCKHAQVFRFFWLQRPALGAHHFSEFIPRCTCWSCDRHVDVTTSQCRFTILLMEDCMCQQAKMDPSRLVRLIV